MVEPPRRWRWTWLNWQLRGDARAAACFVDNRCGLCTDEQWTIERKNFPAL
jgi:hypothetical protein